MPHLIPTSLERKPQRRHISLPANDPDAGEERKKAYERGAVLVSRID
jgi:hypothetical protein